MEYLYVCQFSNGHIKVGRSIDPKSRVATHAERVSCLGVELVAHHFAPCVGRAAPAEAELIRQCAELATARNANEWFSGLDFKEICNLADMVCSTDFPGYIAGTNCVDWKTIILDIQAKHGMNQLQIAKRCECGQATISDLVSGQTKEPRHSLGDSLIQLLASEAPTKEAV